jgi:hypothetical protein
MLMISISLAYPAASCGECARIANSREIQMIRKSTNIIIDAFYYEYNFHSTDAKAAKFPFLSKENRKDRLVKQKGIPGLSADSWSHRTAVDG